MEEKESGKEPDKHIYHHKELDESVHHHQNKPHKRNKPLNKSFYLKLYVVFGIALIVFGVYNITQGALLGALFDQKLIEAKEAAIPAKIELVTIQDSDCPECFDISAIVDSLKKANVNITTEKNLDLSSDVAKKLIEKYDLKKIPTVLLSGEIDKVNIKDLEKKENILLFTQLIPPYTDAKTSKVIGKVSTILIEDPSCDQCIDLSKILNVLKQSGVFVDEQNSLAASNDQAQELIKRLGVEKLPTFLISNDIDVYPFAEKIKQAGYLLKEGYYVIESGAPYVEVSTGKIRGLLTLTMINNDLCEQCYDVDLHKQILAQMGLAIEKEKTLDINSMEGIQLRMKYKLVNVPTVILTGDIETYKGFDQLWQQVGTVEEDGAYVFRNIELLGPGIVYANLDSGEIIGAATLN